MPEKVSITKTKLDNLANAISAKSGEPLNLTIDEMEAAVNGINIGEENVLEGVKVNGVELPIDNQKKVNIPVVSENKAGVMTPSIMNEIFNVTNYLSSNKADKSEIPTKTSQLTNDSKYQTDTEVNNAITDALADIVGFSIEIVNTLPAAGEDGIFYFVPNSGEQNNIYDEYLYVNNAWEKLGTTEIDLSNYLQKTDISAWAKEPNKPTYTAAEVGALPDTTVITDEKLKVDNNISSNTLYYPILTTSSTEASTKIRSGGLMYARDSMDDTLAIGDFSSTINRRGALAFQGGTYKVILRASNISDSNKIINIPNKAGTMALTDDIPSVPVTSVNNQTGDVNLSIPDSTSDLTNDSGFITSASLPTKVSDLTNDTGYITGYTETDPVFSASPAAGITSSDITSWNNKVSDDKTWNGVPLEKTVSLIQNDTVYVLGSSSTNPNAAYFIPAVANKTGTFASQRIAKYDGSGYLFSTTPSANDNSTKVATTAYVDRAIPTIPTNVSSFTNDSGYLTLADLPIYDGTVV